MAIVACFVYQRHMEENAPVVREYHYKQMKKHVSEVITLNFELSMDRLRILLFRRNVC